MRLKSCSNVSKIFVTSYLHISLRIYCFLKIFLIKIVLVNCSEPGENFVLNLVQIMEFYGYTTFSRFRAFLDDFWLQNGAQLFKILIEFQFKSSQHLEILWRHFFMIVLFPQKKRWTCVESLSDMSENYPKTSDICHKENSSLFIRVYWGPKESSRNHQVA